MVAEFVPFGSVIGRVKDAVVNCFSTLKGNDDLSAKLLKSLDMSRGVIEKMTQLVQTNSQEDTYLRIALGFLDIVGQIRAKCAKWGNKSLGKKLWGMNSYKAEFQELRRELDEYCNYMTVWTVATVQGR